MPVTILKMMIMTKIMTIVSIIDPLIDVNAPCRIRTYIAVKPADFKSAAYTIPPTGLILSQACKSVELGEHITRW